MPLEAAILNDAAHHAGLLHADLIILQLGLSQNDGAWPSFYINLQEELSVRAEIGLSLRAIPIFVWREESVELMAQDLGFDRVGRERGHALLRETG